MMSTHLALQATQLPRSAGIDASWMQFWFTPADSRPLAMVRVLSASVALLLWWSYLADLQVWLGPEGVLPTEMVAQWRLNGGFSLFDFARSAVAVWVLFGITGVCFLLLMCGLCTSLVALLAAVFWASLMLAAPMLAGPADDCLAVLLWCLAIGPAGNFFSIDRWLSLRGGQPIAMPSWRASIALGLIQVHASVISGAMFLAQLKGDVWWDGSAAWWLAVRSESPLMNVQGALAQSDYLMNAVTHSITLFEILFAIGLWITPLRPIVATAGLLAWPLIGILAGEPLWGLTMVIFAVPSCLTRPTSA